jgi:K+-transporting ATPase ATPase C chain
MIDTVRQRVEDYRKENNLSPGTSVPADAVTSSGSGLDPHITVENAVLQARRVALARGMSDQGIQRRIAEHTEGRTLGIFGEPRVNVLTLNLALDGRL